MKTLTQEQIDNFKKELSNQINNRDIESAHADADTILCNILIELGYKELVDLYNKVDKWYA